MAIMVQEDVKSRLLGPGDLYVADMSWEERGSRVVQLDFASEDDTLLLICFRSGR